MTAAALESWRDYKPIAFLAPLPHQLAEKTHLTFRDSHDDLDFLKESAFSGSAGTIFGLVSHRGAPVPGTQLLAHEEDLAKGSTALVSEALVALSLTHDQVRWIAEIEEPTTSNRVFLSVSSDEESKKLQVLLRRELTRSGFEPIVADEAVLLTARIDTLRELINQCSHVIVAGRTGPWTTYELGIANALNKNIWRLVRGRFVFIPSSEPLADVLQVATPSERAHWSYFTKLKWHFEHKRWPLSFRGFDTETENVQRVQDLVSALERMSSRIGT